MSEVLRWPLGISERIPTRILEPLVAEKGRKFTPRLHCEDVGVIKRIVADSDMVGLAPISMFRDELELEKLTALRIDAPWLVTSFSIVRLKDRTKSAGMSAFIEEVIAYENELAQEEAKLVAQHLA